MTRNRIPDGLQEISDEMPIIMKMIARTARWVHPAVFKSLPVWRPDTARNLPIYKADWNTRATNKGDVKSEGNVAAQSSLLSALGVVGRRPSGWTTCHIWGYDDNGFMGRSRIVQDRRYFSCVGNMILLPTPLKGFTDAVPEIKFQLRVCGFHLYGWACEHPDVIDEATIVRSGAIPEGYPSDWPTGDHHILPPGTGPYNDIVKSKIAARKNQILRLLNDQTLKEYPRAEVQAVLDFWKINLKVPI
jgi:hypothetical protein